MAATTLGIVNFSNLKSKNQLKSENCNVNINDQSMDQIIVNKKSKINHTIGLPTQISTSQTNDIKTVLGTIVMNQQANQQIVQPSKKRRVSDGNSTGKVKQPQAVAVARRNARERNRVKQVNNGFAALREHIPEEIAETYESAGRGSAKKLSKVETLRMAVEYIRVLENMLNIDSTKDTSSFNNTSTFSNLSSNISEASLPATPPPDQPIFYAIKPRQMNTNDVLGATETQITIINGHQYLRIPGTNTFQLITPNDHFENEENVHPNDEFVQTNFLQTPIQFANQHSETPSPSHTSTNNLLDSSSSLNFINNSNNSSTTTTAMQETPLRIITPAGSISPSSYSGHSSLSPATSQIDNINNNIIMKEPKFQIISATGHETENNHYKPVHFANNIIMVTENDSSINDSHYDNIILKEEIDDESMFDDGSLNNHMLEAVSWYQQQLIQNNQNNSP
jgi:hypothetical protein